MKFSRRAEGIKESRAVFKRSREDTRSSHHVSEAFACLGSYKKQVKLK